MDSDEREVAEMSADAGANDTTRKTLCEYLVDVGKLDPANIERGHGRGLLLMQTFMNEVTHNEKGNEVTLIKRPQPEPAPVPATEA